MDFKFQNIFNAVNTNYLIPTRLVSIKLKIKVDQCMCTIYIYIYIPLHIIILL